MMQRISFLRPCGWSVLLLLTMAGGAHARNKQSSGVHVAEASNIRADTRSDSHGAAISHGEYVIGPEDVLAIDVWREPEISRAEPVRPDGKITLPLVGEIEASGRTTGALQAEIASRLSNYIHQPAVTVIVQQANSHRFNIIGDVLRPGTYPLDAKMTVLDAIATAEGFGEFAKALHRRLFEG
jgi:protein involved in polysaccharide export with SLBB domain